MPSDPFPQLFALTAKINFALLALIKRRLAALKIKDINCKQALILINIASEEITVGELCLRDWYVGTNASYNVGKLVETGYLIKWSSPKDARLSYIRSSKKGLEIRKQLLSIFEKIEKELSQTTLKTSDIVQTLSRLDKILSHLQ